MFNAFIRDSELNFLIHLLRKNNTKAMITYSPTELSNMHNTHYEKEDIKHKTNPIRIGKFIHQYNIEGFKMTHIREGNIYEMDVKTAINWMIAREHIEDNFWELDSISNSIDESLLSSSILNGKYNKHINNIL